MINIFAKRSIGIDISDNNIEVVELIVDKKDIKINSLNRIILEKGIVEGGRIKDYGRLAQIVENALQNAEPEPIEKGTIIFGLPESQVFAHIFHFLVEKQEEIETRIKEEVYSTIPIEKDAVLFEYRIIGNPKIKANHENEITALIVATQKAVADEWSNFFQNLKLSLSALDIETLAVFRGIYNALPSKPVCVVDIGSRTTNLAIFSSNGLDFAQSIPQAGNAITKAISNILSINREKAEELKKEKDLDKINDQVVMIAHEVLEEIIDEVKINIEYYNKTRSTKVHEIILIGGTSNFSGTLDQFKKLFQDMPVILGAPIFKRPNVRLEYIEAIGLALRGIESKWKKTDPCFKARSEKYGASFSGFSSLQLPKFQVFQNINKKFILIISIILLFLIIGMAMLKAITNPWQAQVSQFNYKKIHSSGYAIPVHFDFYVSTGETNQFNKIAKGKIISNTIEKAMDMQIAQEQSYQKARQALERGWILANQPISPSPESGSAVFPLLFEWLALEQKQLDILFLNNLQIKLENQTISIQTVAINKIIPTNKPNIYKARGQVSIVANNKISIGAVDLIQDIDPGQSSKWVQIKELNQNLNVRSGPGSNFGIIGSAVPGNKYQLLERQADWLKIVLDNENIGWVYANFAQILE